jgi:hypothetical protein
LVVSADECRIAVAVGKIHIKEITEINKILVYSLNAQGQYELLKIREWDE